MRPIEFRAFNTEINKMLDWRMCRASYGTDALFIRPEYYSLKVMQYVGLKDKNGTKIFEGDIIFDSHVVVFENGMFLHRSPNRELHMFGGWHDQESCQVIGNVFENPELLEVK